MVASPCTCGNHETGILLVCYRCCVLAVVSSAARSKIADHVGIIVIYKDGTVCTEHRSPMFVTWKHKDELRGCIGTTALCLLSTGLRKYALKSAFEDSRFDPIGKSEFSTLTCTVSVLTDDEMCKDWKDWEIGKHGVSIRYTDPKTKKVHHALFLPEVMVDHELNHCSTMEHLFEKAGYHDKITKSILEDVQVTRFRSMKHSVKVSEYLAQQKQNSTS